MVGQWFDFRRYGGVMGLVSLSYLIGDAASRLVLGELVKHGWDWRQIFFAAASCLAVFTVGTFFLLKESPVDAGLPKVESNPELRVSDSVTQVGDVLGAIFRQSSFWIVCALSFGFTLLRETFNDWTPLYLEKVAGLTKGDAGMASSLFPLFGALSVVIVGFATDKISKGGRAMMILVGLLFGAIGLAGLGSLGVGSAQWIYVALVAAIAFVLIGPYSLLAGAISLDFGGPKAGGVAAGWIDGIGYVGGILSGYGVAAIAERFGWTTAWMVLAGVAIISAVFAFSFLAAGRRLATN